MAEGNIRLNRAVNIRDVPEEYFQRLRRECFERQMTQAQYLMWLMDTALERTPVALEGFPVSAGTALGA
jgi:hypothetical protein